MGRKYGDIIKGPRTGSKRYFNRGANEEAGALDYKVEVTKKQQLKPYDTLLKEFQYQKALDAALGMTPSYRP